MNHSAALIAGKNGSIMEVLPKFECYRDIVLHSFWGNLSCLPRQRKIRSGYPRMHHFTGRWEEKEKQNGEVEKIIIYEYRAVTALGNHPNNLSIEWGLSRRARQRLKDSWHYLARQ